MSTTTVANPDAVTITDGSGAPVINRVNLSQPTPADATGTNGGQQGSDDKTFTKAELEAILKDRLERDRRKRDDEAAKAKTDAELKALEEQQLHKERADKLATELLAEQAKAAAIEPLTAERDQLAAVVTDLVKQHREGLPESIIELLDSKSPVEQLAWLNKNRETLTGRTGGPTTGVPGLPRPVTNVSRDEQIRAEIEAQRARPRR